MKTIIAANGKKMKVDETEYKELQQAFIEGFDEMGIRDGKGRWHQIPLAKNFEVFHEMVVGELKNEIEKL